jgi:hypothetical protein
MSLTKLSLAGINLFIPGQGEFGNSDIPAGYRKIANLLLQCMYDSSFTGRSDQNFVNYMFYFVMAGWGRG